MFGSSFFHDYEPESFYSSPLQSMFGGYPRQKTPLSCRFADINNNSLNSNMNRQREAQLAAQLEMERQRRARELDRHRNQRLRQQKTRGRPVVFRPKPFEKTIDISDFDPDQLQIRFVNGELVIRSPGNVRYGYSIRRMMLERKVPLPEDVIEDEIQCQIDRYGRLKITAPRKLATRYESDNDQVTSDEDADEEKENEVSLPVSRTTRQSPEVPSPRLASEAQAQPAVPIGTKTDQVLKEKKPKSRYEYTECDADITVEDEY